MDHPGHERIALIGHDRGACVGTWFAKDQADRIHRFVAMDTIPTRVIADTYDVNLARQGYWFFTFLGVPDLPEALIAGREDIWLSTSTGVGRTTRTCALPRDSRLRTRLPTAGCGAGVLQDFRAAPQDVARDREDAGHLIDCPVLTMWGEDFSTVGQAYDVLDAWKGPARTSRVSGFLSAVATAGRNARRRRRRPPGTGCGCLLPPFLPVVLPGDRRAPLVGCVCGREPRPRRSRPVALSSEVAARTTSRPFLPDTGPAFRGGPAVRCSP